MILSYLPLCQASMNIWVIGVKNIFISGLLFPNQSPNNFTYSFLNLISIMLQIHNKSILPGSNSLQTTQIGHNETEDL